MGGVRLDEGKTASFDWGRTSKFGSSRFSQNSCGLEQVPKKLPGFFGSDMLQLFEPKRFLVDQMSPSDRQAP